MSLHRLCKCSHDGEGGRPAPTTFLSWVVSNKLPTRSPYVKNREDRIHERKLLIHSDLPGVQFLRPHPSPVTLTPTILDFNTPDSPLSHGRCLLLVLVHPYVVGGLLIRIFLEFWGPDYSKVRTDTLFSTYVDIVFRPGDSGPHVSKEPLKPSITPKYRLRKSQYYPNPPTVLP